MQYIRKYFDVYIKDVLHLKLQREKGFESEQPRYDFFEAIKIYGITHGSIKRRQLRLCMLILYI